MLDTSAIGDLIADTMLKLEGEYPEGRVRSVALVVEVDDGEKPTKWSVHGDDRIWLNQRVLEQGLDQLEAEADCEGVCAEEEGDD